MKTSKALWIFFISIIVLSLCLIAFAFVVDVDAAPADPDCHHGCPPHRLEKIYIALITQYRPAWWDGDNSGDADTGILNLGQH